MLGKIINEYIEQQKITQEQFADSVGITARMLRYILAGTHTPSVPVLKRIKRIKNQGIYC